MIYPSEATVIPMRMRALDVVTRPIRHYFVLIPALLCLPVVAVAQGVTGFGDYEVVSASYHKFVLPGESSLQVLVLGSVGAPGIYEIGAGSDLGQLMALSGVPLGEISEDVKTKTTIRLYRGQSGRRDVVYEASVEEFLAAPGRYPTLAEEDVLVVETITKAKFNWRDILAIVTSLGTITLIVDRLAQ